MSERALNGFGQLGDGSYKLEDAELNGLRWFVYSRGVYVCVKAAAYDEAYLQAVRRQTVAPLLLLLFYCIEHLWSGLARIC